MTALTGPVRHVETVPVQAVSMDIAPQAAVMALTGGWCPAARSTAMPWAFCTTSTAMVSGMTSSIKARHENTGAWRLGRASMKVPPAAGWNSPSATTMTAPTIMAAIRGGTRGARRGTALTAKNTSTMGAAIQN